MSAPSILVTPLQPPFSEDIMVFNFEHDDKLLALSRSDGEKLAALLGGKPLGRSVVMEADGDKKIRVHITQ